MFTVILYFMPAMLTAFSMLYDDTYGNHVYKNIENEEFRAVIKVMLIFVPFINWYGFVWAYDTLHEWADSHL